MLLAAALVSLLAAVPASALADPVVASSSGPLTLAQCVETALAAAPTVKAADFNVEESHRLWLKALANFYPQASVTGSDVFAGYDNYGDLITSPRYDEATHVYNAAASWNLFNDGNDWRAQRQAKLDERASGEDLETARQALILQTVQAYFGELLARRLLELARGFSDAQDQQLKVTEQLYGSGVRSYTDLLDARVEAREKELAVVSAESGERQARGALNLLLERPLDQPLALQDVSDTPEVPGGLDSDLDAALKNRPDALKARLELDKQEIAVQSAWAALLPALSVGGTLAYRFDEPSYTIAPGVTVTGTNPYYQASASVSFPVFDGFSRWQDVRDAKLALEAQREDWRELVREISAQVLDAREKLEQSRSAFELASEETRTSQEELGLLLEQYRDGTATAVDVRNARNDLLQLEQARANSLYQYYIDRAQLFQAQGALRPESL